MDKKLFLTCINSLESAFGEELSKNRIKIYWEILGNYNEKDMKNAIIKLIRELKFFPKISEIIEAIEGDPEDEAELAYLEFREKLDDEGSYLSVSFPKHPAIGATIEALGGWIKVSDTSKEEEKWLRKDFIKLYNIMKKRNEYPDKLVGRFEIENSNKGYTEKTMLGYGRYLDGEKVDRKLIEDYKEGEE